MPGARRRVSPARRTSRRDVGAVAASSPGGLELFEGVFAGEFQQEEPAAPVPPQQALLDQRLKTVEIRTTDGFRGLEFEAPGEHAKPAK